MQQCKIARIRISRNTTDEQSIFDYRVYWYLQALTHYEWTIDDRKATIHDLAKGLPRQGISSSMVKWRKRSGAQVCTWLLEHECLWLHYVYKMKRRKPNFLAQCWVIVISFLTKPRLMINALQAIWKYRIMMNHVCFANATGWLRF